jgi:hypothetical protein
LPRTAPRREQPLKSGFGFGEIDAAEARQLKQLAFDHALREFNQNVEDGEVALAKRRVERLHIEPVAGEDAHVIAPASIGARAAATGVRAVDHVVVNQRRAVNHFYDGAEANRAAPVVAGSSRGEQKQRRTQALAPTFPQIFGDFRDGLDRRAVLRRDFLLDERQILADQVEDASCDGNGEGHSLWFTLPGLDEPHLA